MAAIEAVIVNHDTSPFSELCLRTLRARNRDLDRDLAVTVVDNHSTDDGLEELVAAVHELGATFERSRLPLQTATVNAHGDVLRDFVRTHPNADHYLFLDADIAFVEPDTVATMRTELDADPTLWAVQARFSWSEHHRRTGSSLDMGAGTPQRLYGGFQDPDSGDRITFPVEGSGQRPCRLLRHPRPGVRGDGHPRPPLRAVDRERRPLLQRQLRRPDRPHGGEASRLPTPARGPPRRPVRHDHARPLGLTGEYRRS